ncbi:hypothetical protein D3C77_603280 [compost metagenome]
MQQFTAGGRIGGHIQTQQADVAQCGQHIGTGEHLFLHDFARHTPVGIVVQHHPLALGLGGIQLALQFSRLADGDKGIAVYSAGNHASTGAEGLQRLPGVVAAG